MSEVEYEALCLLSTKPSGNYERWTQELFRRRYAKEKADVEVAEAAFRAACKGGTFTEEEAAVHAKTFREADSQLSINRASLSELIRSAAEDLEFAKKLDKQATARI
jgi:hypothetical protein